MCCIVCTRLASVERTFLSADQGIRFLHNQHVIHRDFKPENILIKEIDPNKVRTGMFEATRWAEFEVGGL